MRAVILIAIAALCLASCDPSPIVSSPVRVIRKGLVIEHRPYATPVMSRADDGSRRLAELQGHDSVYVTDHEEKGWTLVQYGPNKDEGFVQTDDITPAKFAKPAKLKGRHIDLKANPGIYQQTIKVLALPDSVDYLADFDDNWVHVCLKDGTVGFIKKNQLAR